MRRATRVPPLFGMIRASPVQEGHDADAAPMTAALSRRVAALQPRAKNQTAVICSEMVFASGYRQSGLRPAPIQQAQPSFDHADEVGVLDQLAE